MLVLSRKTEESIVIGQDIVVKVVKISGGRVRIAIDAPAHIRVSRGELLETTLSLPSEATSVELGTTEFQQAP